MHQTKKFNNIRSFTKQMCSDLGFMFVAFCGCLLTLELKFDLIKNAQILTQLQVKVY